MLSKIYRRFVYQVWKNLNRLNYIQVTAPDAISKKAVLRGCTLLGDIRVDDYAKITGGVKLRGRVIIGRNTSISGPNTDLLSEINPITIGNFCSIARNVSFQEYNHHYHRLTSYFMLHNIFGEGIEQDIHSKGAIEVGHDVWVGAGCIILSGAKIGHGSVIAANSVVSTDIPPYSIAAGSPAKIVKRRFSQEIIDRMLELEWWNWSHNKIKKNRHLFIGEISINRLSEVYS